MSTAGVLLLVVASVVTAQRARQSSAPAASRLRWLSLALAAAALGLALWTVLRMVGDHRRSASAAATAPVADAPAAAAMPARDTAVTLVVEGEGLRLFLQPSGSSRPLAFGAPRADVVAGVSRALGAATAQGENVDCGARFAEWATAGLTTWFTGNGTVFAGWSLRDGSRLTTASGIGLGSTSADLRAAYATARSQRSTLGEEFSIGGGMAGLLTSAGPDARVQNLWAGVACVAR